MIKILWIYNVEALKLDNAKLEVTQTPLKCLIISLQNVTCFSNFISIILNFEAFPIMRLSVLIKWKRFGINCKLHWKKSVIFN